MSSVVITGTNRGIGLELARIYAGRGDDVTATCRQPSPQLEALGVRVVNDIDVTDDGSVGRLAAAVGAEPIDILVNNAGTLSDENIDDLDLGRIRTQIEVNTLGPLRVTRALLANLATGSKVAILSSRMGSLGDNSQGGYYGYRISKAAVNMAGLNLALDLRPRGIALILLHPGLVATRMTGERGISPAEAAANLIARIDALTLDTTGGFVDAVGGEHFPW